MFCPKCRGIEEVIKIHNINDDAPRLCDVKCLNCGNITYYRPYDFGSNLNLVSDKDINKSTIKLYF